MVEGAGSNVANRSEEFSPRGPLDRSFQNKCQPGVRPEVVHKSARNRAVKARQISLGARHESDAELLVVILYYLVLLDIQRVAKRHRKIGEHHDAPIPML